MNAPYSRKSLSNLVLQLESLEARRLFAMVEWIGPAEGNWNEPSNWSGGMVPGVNDDVRIVGDVEVTLDSGAQSIRSLYCEFADLLMSGGSLELSNGGTFFGGRLTLSDGLLETDSPLVFDAIGGLAMSGGTVRGDLSITGAAALSWTGGIMDSPGSTTLSIQASSYIGGPGTLELRRPLINNARFMYLGGNLRLTNGSFTHNPATLQPMFTGSGTVLDGGGTNLFQVSSGLMELAKGASYNVKVPLMVQGGIHGEGSLHILSGATITGALLGGDYYFEGGSSSVGSVNSSNTMSGLHVVEGAHVTLTCDHLVVGATQISGAGSTLTMAGAGGDYLQTKSLSIVNGGVLDLGRESLIVDYDTADTSPLPSIRTMLASGYASGTWNGTGINSSHAASTSGYAVGYAEATGIFSTFPATFMGQPVDDTSVLVTATRYGDANLDRFVNLADFNRLVGNFGTGNLWEQGNFNYDGIVGLPDFNRLAGQFGQSAGTDADDPLLSLLAAHQR